MNNQEQQKQTPQDVFVQSLLDEISQKSAVIAQLNANVAEGNQKYKELLDKYNEVTKVESK